MSVACHFTNLTLGFDDRPLFDGITATLPTGISGLIGPNGSGKSVLLKVLSGDLTPARGDLQWDRPCYRLAQVPHVHGIRIADALGVGNLFDAFAGIERGRARPEDLDLVADSWHLPAEWQMLLTDAGLEAPLDTPVAQLSGGQRTRLALCAAFGRRNHFLLLDEPSNHLDAAGRLWLIEKLRGHPGGALVASHDRTLLNQVDTLFELRNLRLHRYGGGYDHYRSLREAEKTGLEQKIVASQRQLRTLKQGAEAAHARAAGRRRQGMRLRRSGSQSKLLLDAKSNSAECSHAREKALQEQRSQRIREELSALEGKREQLRPQQLAIQEEGLRAGRRLSLEALQLQWVEHAPISLTVYSGERWRIQGANGCGKSTLLKTIHGELQPRAGECHRSGSSIYLDQDFGLLDGGQSAVENLCRLHPGVGATEWRTRLASMRLRGDKGLQRVAELSGGERLKVALLAVTAGPQAPDILLLDEPDNHLDLDSKEILEAALRNYAGTLILISHDEYFVQQAGVQETLLL